MKTYDEMWNSLLERREQYRAAQKKKRKILLSVTASLCVVVLVGVALWQGLAGIVLPPVVDSGDATPSIPTYEILWGKEHPTDDVEDNDSGEWTREEYGKHCGFLLDRLFSNKHLYTDEDMLGKIAIFAQSYAYQSTLFQYQVNGQDMSVYKTALEQHRDLVQDLKTLVESNGETQSVDQDLLVRYFEDDVFLADQAEVDLMLAENDRSAQLAYDEACEAYQKYAVVQLKDRLEKLGFDCYYTEGAEYVMFFASEQEFASLSFGEAEDDNWIYDWATEPMSMRGGGNTDFTYVYNGKTVHQYYMEWWESHYPEDKFYNLIHEEGELLKHGEDLYLGTDPNGDPWLDVCGVPWTKQTYENCVAYYGEGMLCKYIVDGEFLKELAQADWDAAKKQYEEAKQRYEEACVASQKNGTAELKKELEELGYTCEFAEDKMEVLFQISVQEYESLPLDVTEKNWFRWASVTVDGTLLYDDNEDAINCWI